VSTLTLRNVGKTVRLDVLRGTQPLTLAIPVIERPDRFNRLMEGVDPERNLVRRIGIIGIALDSISTNAVPGLRYPSGVLVVALAGYGGSVESGLIPGDVIHSVNRKRVAGLDDLRSVLLDLKVGSPAVLQIEREGVFKFLQFEIE